MNDKRAEVAALLRVKQLAGRVKSLGDQLASLERRFARGADAVSADLEEGLTKQAAEAGAAEAGKLTASVREGVSQLEAELKTAKEALAGAQGELESATGAAARASEAQAAEIRKKVSTEQLETATRDLEKGLSAANKGTAKVSGKVAGLATELSKDRVKTRDRFAKLNSSLSGLSSRQARLATTDALSAVAAKARELAEANSLATKKTLERFKKDLDGFVTKRAFNKKIKEIEECIEVLRRAALSAGGSTRIIKQGGNMSPLSGYVLSDEDCQDQVDYFGHVKETSPQAWYIRRVTQTGDEVTHEFAVPADNPTINDYDEAWTDKATLVYKRFTEVDVP